MTMRYQQGVPSPLSFIVKRGNLGQLAPSATTYTTLYEPAEGISAEAYVVVANRGGSASTFRISLDTDGSGTTPATKEFVVYDVSLANADTWESPIYTIGQEGRIRVYASSGDLSFNALGVEYVG